MKYDPNAANRPTRQPPDPTSPLSYARTWTQSLITPHVSYNWPDTQIACLSCGGPAVAPRLKIWLELSTAEYQTNLRANVF